MTSANHDCAAALEGVLAALHALTAVLEAGKTNPGSLWETLAQVERLNPALKFHNGTKQGTRVSVEVTKLVRALHESELDALRLQAFTDSQQDRRDRH